MLIKFRTMAEDRNASGTLLPDNERVTRLGLALRRSSIDELPELINVLRGEMSLVGPRPLLPEYLELYTDRERLRHSVFPGLTGLAQVAGRNCLDWDTKLAKDIEYVEQQSLWLDTVIIARTIIVVLAGNGVTDGSGVSCDPLSSVRKQTSNVDNRSIHL